jgi:hypothetical protein
LQVAILYKGPVTIVREGTMCRHSTRRAATISSVILAAIVFPAVMAAQIVVRGELYDDVTGLPVRGAVMLVDPATDGAVVHTVSDTQGQFELKTGSGIYQIAAVRSGYTSMLSAPITFARGEQMTVRVPISQVGDPTHHISVLQHIRPARSIADGEMHNEGMAQRKLLGTGLQYDAAAIARSSAETVGQFLENVPGFVVTDPNSTQSMRMTRTAGIYAGQSLGDGRSTPQTCQLAWFVDGRRFDRGGLDPITDGLGSMTLNAVDAIEVFRGISEMPPQFAEPDIRCGAVAIWIRH